ncbi:MAG: ExbD/TolR family protein [Candidatus Krumholzibacteriia bacterium]
MRRRRRRVIEEIPQASLPDLAFLLLIFFITSTIFAVEHGLPLVLPSAQKSATVTVEASEVFRIQGYPDDRVTVDGAPVAVGEIGPLLMARNAERLARDEPQLIVLIETHPEATYRLMVEILDQVRAAEPRRVALQLLEEVSR